MAEVAAHHGIVFIGFMAAGKTRAAQAVAERLGLGVIDTDELLERELGEPIASFFEREGRSSSAAARSGWWSRCSMRWPARSGARVRGRARRRRDRERGRTPRAADHLPVWCDVDEEVAWERARDPTGPWPPTGRILRAIRSPEAPLRVACARDPALGGRDAAGSRGAVAGRDAGRSRRADGLGRIGKRSYAAAVGEGAIGLLDDAREALPEALPARTFCVADERRCGTTGPAAADRGDHRRSGRGDLEDDRGGRADSQRALSAGANRDDACWRSGAAWSGTSEASVPPPTSVCSSRPGAHDPRRPGRLGLRRQNRSRSPDCEELRRRVPYADRGPGRSGDADDASP